MCNLFSIFYFDEILTHLNLVEDNNLLIKLVVCVLGNRVYTVDYKW